MVSLIFLNSDRTPLFFHGPTHPTETAEFRRLVYNKSEFSRRLRSFVTCPLSYIYIYIYARRLLLLHNAELINSLCRDSQHSQLSYLGEQSEPRAAASRASTFHDISFK